MDLLRRVLLHAVRAAFRAGRNGARAERGVRPRCGGCERARRPVLLQLFGVFDRRRRGAGPARRQGCHSSWHRSRCRRGGTVRPGHRGDRGNRPPAARRGLGVRIHRGRISRHAWLSPALSRDGGRLHAMLRNAGRVRGPVRRRPADSRPHHVAAVLVAVRPRNLCDCRTGVHRDAGRP
ncbi:hypothetical protein D3C72_1519880 [compost metagenome]